MAPGLWAATHTADSGRKGNGDAVLQVLFNKWTASVQEELADHFGLDATPLPTFQTKDQTITSLVKQHTGALSRASDQEEWLWRRLTELRSTIAAGHNPNEGLKALAKGVKTQTNLKLWQEAVEWLKMVHEGQGLTGYESCLDQLVGIAKNQKTRSLNADRGRANTEWHVFVAKACEKGAGFAHSWTKPLEAQPMHTATLGGYTSSDPAHRLQSQASKWAGYWGSRNNDNDELIWPSWPMQQRMSTDWLRSTALIFPHTRLPGTAGIPGSSPSCLELPWRLSLTCSGPLSSMETSLLA